MSNSICLYFVKFFSEESHADQFLAGKLYANRLSYFQKLEEKYDDGRSDRHEAIAAWMQPDTTSITFSGASHLNISSHDLAAPVSVSFNFHSNWHVFCLYSICVDGFDFVDGAFDLSEEDKQKFEQQLRIDDRCVNLGNFAVMVRADCFIEQVKKAMHEAERNIVGDLVKYYDPSTFNGKFTIREIPFQKQNKFSYQREYRICFPTTDNGDDALIFDIGDISTYSAKVEAAKINNLISFNYRKAHQR